MPSDTGAARAKSSAVPLPVNSETQRSKEKVNHRVSQRAYQLYEGSGADHGRDLEHWLRAESELFPRIEEIQDSGSVFTAAASLPGFGPEDISVSVDSASALIIADKHSSRTEVGADALATDASFAFFRIDWPAEVDPATATASFDHSRLLITVKRTTPKFATNS